jgi:hypothetical protein
VPAAGRSRPLVMTAVVVVGVLGIVIALTARDSTVGRTPEPVDRTEPRVGLVEGRSGLLHSAQEVEVWRRRAVQGPYRVAGDVSSNSPGDWARIRQNADRFLANPAAGRWNGPSQGSLSTCVQKWDSEPPTGGPSELRDAAFVALVTGSAVEAGVVKRELLWQASAAGTDFTNRSRWCTGVLIDVNPSFAITEWLTKLLLAYDYLGPDAFTATERAKLDGWFLEAARFWRIDLDRALESNFKDRGNSDELSAARTTNPYCSRVFYLDGPQSCAIHQFYNNRRAVIARFVGLVGIHQKDETLKRSARLWTEEFVKYGVFPQGFAGDLERWSSSLPDLGWAYGANTVSATLTIADVFARAGDPSLYRFSTSVGAYGSGGGPKDLLFAARTFGKHVDGTYRRYGTNDPAHRGNPAYLIDARNDATGWYGVHDIAFAQANVYYRDSYLRGAYMRTGPGMGGYPQRPAGNGPHPAWTGPGGVFPGILFMYGQAENNPTPY